VGIRYGRELATALCSHPQLVAFTILVVSILFILGAVFSLDDDRATRTECGIAASAVNIAFVLVIVKNSVSASVLQFLVAAELAWALVPILMARAYFRWRRPLEEPP
jgi:hypothetical protein